MTPEEKKSGVKRLGPWFHRIDLGDGVITKTESLSGEPADHPLGPWRIIRECLPPDLTGLRVLDVGCNGGFFAVEAKRRNAAYVLGVDSQRHQVRQAQFVRRALDLDIEFRRLSVYDLSRKALGEFDVTLALGLVYHCKHLILALERLFDVTREMLILETAVLLPEVFAAAPTPFPVGSITRTLHPLGYFENTPDSKESVFNWFLPSTSAMAALVRDVGFSEVSLVEVRGDRGTFLCRKFAGAAVAISLESFAAALRVESGPRAAPRDSHLTFRVRAENVGLASWRASADRGAQKGVVSLGMRLLQGEEEVDWDFGRASLPHDLAPGDAEILTLQFHAPSEPGVYFLEFDMIAEQISWFEDFGSAVARHTLSVEELGDGIPWFRLEGLLYGLESRGLKVPREASCPELVELAARTLAQLSAVDPAAVETAFRWILGFQPDESTSAGLRLLTRGQSERLPIVVRRLLTRADSREVPEAPSGECLVALGRRIECAKAEQRPVATCGSFPLEAAMARLLLEEGGDLDDERFVRLAYRRVLGREADPEGAGNAVAKLSVGETNRPHFLRDLFWSEELRSIP
jgi:tRNA (mo5U34)-methyltransferase